ncbi:MAG: hypothetical protein ABJN69_09330 [Hellea sp.]
MTAETDIAPESFPAAYHAFLPVLERLTEPMLRVLHGHLMSLESMLRSVQSQSLSVKGDFEGIGGLTLRGDINRIIQSELLLRSEVPLEFLRRVSEGEALYMETEHSNPDEQVVYRVIISVGPYMLGHGRLIALASLIFLARAALARNAVLHWTYLPTDKTVNWFEGLSVNSVKRFLKFASFRDVNEGDVDGAIAQWDAFNTEISSEFSDVESWLIAASGISGATTEDQNLTETFANALILTLDPPPSTGHQTANIDLQRQGRNIRRLKIDFPRDEICVSALNRPFNPKKLDAQPHESGGNFISKNKYWNPNYILSTDTFNHVIRFQHSRSGLLFLTLGNKQYETKRAVFFELTKDANLAGVNFSSEHVAQILSQWNAPEETIFFHELDTRKMKISNKAKKEVTSKHLFAKQQANAVPPMIAPWGLIKCYTTLGQPFEFSTAKGNKGSINILYKENRVIYADGKYSIVLFDPSKKTAQELQAWSNYIPLDRQGLSLIVLKNHATCIDVYPYLGRLPSDGFRGIFYTPSSHNLVYSIRPGEWHVMGRDSDKLDITLAPYERLIRSHMSNNRCKMIVFSDPALGGENTLKAISSVNGEITGYDTLYNFDKVSSQLGQQNLTEIKTLRNGGLRAVNLDENGDPDKLILLQKIGGQYTPTIIDLEAELASCDYISYEA